LPKTHEDRELFFKRGAHSRHSRVSAHGNCGYHGASVASKARPTCGRPRGADPGRHVP
jgi:hypothetical protein